MTTIRDLYNEGKSRLETRNLPELEARLLLQKALSLKPHEVLIEPRTPVAPERSRRFRQILFRRLAGEPLAYIIGEKEFWSLEIVVRPGVLIPRPESECLVEKVLEFAAGGPVKIADIGTGSGNIALALSRELPGAEILATDISPSAVRTAVLNAERLGLQNVRFAVGDLFGPLASDETGRRFDVIVSNPPYLAVEDWAGLSRDIRDFEPRQALVAGETGLEIIRRLVDGAPLYLRSGGLLAVEMGWGQRDRVLGLFDRNWQEISAFDDLAGISRGVTARLA